jgi:hypothetical protein
LRYGTAGLGGNQIEGDAFVEAVGQPLALRVRHFAFT